MQHDKMLINIKYSVVCIVVCTLLLSCVTQSTDGRERKIDTSKALELHIKMAQGYIEKGNRESARHHLKKAFAINKNSAPATGVMAQLYLLEGEPVLAEAQYKLALKYDPKFTEVYNNYGVFLFNQGRYEESYTVFDKAAADLEYPHRAQALTNLGRVALKLGNTPKAIAVFQHATILDRENPEPYIELADINLQKHEYADAKKYLDMYESLKQQTPRSLVLGVRLEKVFGNKNKEASLVMLLKNRFPYSKEYLEYKNNNFN